MAARADLAGVTVDGWTVLVKAPAQNRVPFWTATHEACGIVADLPHVNLTKAIAGKTKLPACTTCVPADERRNIDHGMHLGCGQAHLIGTPCPASDDCRIVEGRHIVTELGGSYEIPEISPWDQFDEVEVTRVLYYGHPSENGPPRELSISHEVAPPPVELAPFVESVLPIEPAAQLLDASTGDVVTHGRVDRLEAPQPILDVIRAGMHGRQRNHQSQPGPSQLGGCERRLGAHMATGNGNGARGDDSWRPEVGTAVHAWLDQMFTGQADYLSDLAVTSPVAGKLDLYQISAKRVIDFKVSGKASRDNAARGKVSEKYEVQLDLYGLGMVEAGFPVESVALLFLPAAGSLSESVWYERPFNPARALEAVARRERIAAMLSVAPFERVLAALSTTEDFCSGCPALGKYCQGAETAWLPSGLPDSAWPAYDAAVKAAG